MEDALAVKGHTFQLTTEEAQATSDFVDGTCLLFFALYYYLYDLCVHYACMRTTSVIGMSVHVLFYSGATRSFMSLAPSKKFQDPPGTLFSRSR